MQRSNWVTFNVLFPYKKKLIQTKTERHKCTRQKTINKWINDGANRTSKKKPQLFMTVIIEKRRRRPMTTRRARGSARRQNTWNRNESSSSSRPVYNHIRSGAQLSKSTTQPSLIGDDFEWCGGEREREASKNKTCKIDAGDGKCVCLCVLLLHLIASLSFCPLSCFYSFRRAACPAVDRSL